MWAGVRAIVDWCREIISQAKYDWDVIRDLQKQYDNINHNNDLW